MHWFFSTLRKGSLTPGIFALLLLVVSRSVTAAPASSTGELLIRFRSGVSAAQVERVTRSGKLHWKRQVRTRPMQTDGHPGIHLFQTDLDPALALATLRNDPAVASVEPNYLWHATATSNDPLFTSGNLWGMYGDSSTPANAYGSQAAEAWAAGYVGSSGVYVAIIDDGMQIDHPELAANVWTNPFDPPDGIDNDGNGYVDDVHGWNFVAGNNTVYRDGDGHGTHVAGTIGARGGNGIGVAGVNWNVTMIPLKFLSDGTGDTLAAVQAIDYCVDLKTAHSINLVAINASWGGGGYSVELHEAIIRAARAGILFVAAAGNDSANNDLINEFPGNVDTSIGTLAELPASYNSVISVAAIDSNGALASFSDYGASRVHIGAPGVLIYSTYPTNIIGGLSGTSMATPHVTGAVALYASTHPSASASQIRAAILGAAIPTPSLAGKTTTGGRLNLSSIIAPTPVLAPVGSVLSAESWINGVVDPGETVTVQLTLTNMSSVSTTSLVGTLLPGGGVLNPSSSQNFGTLVAGGSSVTRSFSFDASGTCGETITLVLSLHDGATSLGQVTFPLLLGVATNALIEGFDSVTAPNLPPGWSSTLSGSGAKWKTLSGVPGASGNVMFAPNPSAVADNILTSPSIRVRSGSAQLYFRHRFSLEPGWDGGVLEISIAGAPFTDILNAGGTFVQNGYTLVLASQSTLASRAAWSGTSDGFVDTTVQLPANCLDQDIRLRWRCGSDAYVGGNGWYIDSIRVVDGYGCLLPNQSFDEDSLNVPFSFSIGSADTQPGLAISASSSNAGLIPDSSLVITGSGSTRTLVTTPLADQFGNSTVTIKVRSLEATSYRTLNLTVDAVNDPPSFGAGPNVSVPQDSGAHVEPSWASAISFGPSNESGQVLDFIVNAGASWLFAVEPTISSGGALSFTPATHQRGSSIVTVKLHDSGGNAHGGSDTSVTRSFNLTIGASTDTDGDRLPDDFETAFGLNPNNPGDADTDPDGDGFSTYQEFLAGTDPLDSRSRLQILGAESALSGTGIRFNSTLGKTYVVETNSLSAGSSWHSLGVPQVGTGQPLFQPDSSNSDARTVYRIKTTGENGDPVVSQAFGFCRLPLPGNADTLVSLPFTRPVAEFGAVASISANQVKFRGTPGWTDNRWVYSPGTQSNTYYLQVRSGLLEGEFFTIIGSSSDSVTLDLADGSVLSSVAMGDALAIVPYWTLGTIFPGGQGIYASTSPADRLTEVLFPDLSGSGTNRSAAETYYFMGGAWRKVGQGVGIQNDTVVLPDMYFTVRHHLPTTTTLVAQGAMLPGKIHVLVQRDANGRQDNSVALSRPSSVSLNVAGLVASGAVRASTSSTSRLDELFTFDNSASGFNKAANGLYYYLNSAWRKIGSGATDVGDDNVFSPGSGVILRTAPGTAAVWENLP